MKTGAQEQGCFKQKSGINPTFWLKVTAETRETLYTSIQLLKEIRMNMY